MRNRRWNKAAPLGLCCALAFAAGAQAPSPLDPDNAPALPPAGMAIDALADALACRIGEARYPGLMLEIREQRKDDFRQAYRQYSEPMMDVYALREPVQAWGNQGDTIVIASNRVMLAVAGTLDTVTADLEHSLEASTDSPLSGALDDQHALVIFEATEPGLEGLVLLGCEYRIGEVSLLENPEDAWRKTPSTAIAPATP